ncbi:hypothetical protein RQN30_07085 [Arcanobacterium hippocoleae]
MKIVIHPNALKHGLTREQILSAYSTGHNTAKLRSKDQGKYPPRWASIGFDYEGRPIEIIFASGLEQHLIFHANYLTTRFKNEVMK